MADGQKLLASQIAGDLGYKRAWNLREKKEDDEGVPFYLLLAPVMHHDSWNRREKKWRRFGKQQFFSRWKVAAATTLFCAVLLDEEHLLVVGRQRRAVLVLYVIGNGVRPRAFLFHDERTRTSAAWSRTRGEETPMIGSHGVVRIFTHKHGQYANY